MHPARCSHHRRRRTRAFAVLAPLLGMALATSAHAGEPELGRARDAYDRGVRAHAAGDHAAAAKAFAEADALAPTAASLEAALEAAMRADDAALGAELLERSELRPERDASLTKSIEAARRRFVGRTGTIRVDCKGLPRCLFSVDGRAAEGSHAVLTTVGPHTVVVERGDERFERLVEVTPGAVTLVGGDPALVPRPVVLPPPPQLQPEVPTTHGLSPVWFFVGLGATLASGTAATLSGLDVNGKHDEFIADGCGVGSTSSTPKPADCNRRSDEGSGATLRTNLLFGLTALLAVNTAVIGAVFVRWSSAPSGGVATIGGTFR